MPNSNGFIMNCYDITFFYKDCPTPDSPIRVYSDNQSEAMEIIKGLIAKGVDIPGNWDRYSITNHHGL